MLITLLADYAISLIIADAIIDAIIALRHY
jgi:hypothetical protein